MNGVKRSVVSVFKFCRFSNKSVSQVAALRYAYCVPRALCFRYSSYSFAEFRSLATAAVDTAVDTPDNNNIMACPGNRLSWNKTASDIARQADQLIASSKAVYDRVGALKPDQVTYESVIKTLADDNRDFSTARNQLDFLQHVSADKNLREASVAVDKKLSDFDVEISMRQDVFDNLLVAEKLNEDMKPEATRYLQRLIKLGRRAGLHLSKELQDKVKTIKKRISDLSIDFQKNLNEENTTLEFSLDQLVGLPEDFLKSLEKTESGLVKLTLKYPHYFPCMKFARNPDTRQRLETAFNSRCVKENTLILEELIQLRQKQASLLGFKSHAAFVLDMRMAKDPDSVMTFLADLNTKLQPLKKEEMALFLQYKKEECEKYGYECDGKINMWDFRYYMTRVEERKYAVDQNRLKEYFPLNVVTDGLLSIYQELLGLKYEEITDAPLSWHEGISLYRVADAKTDELMGYFYLDLFPREGKYGHAACFGLQPGCLDSDGSRQVSVAAMVANFTKPVEDKPSLLTHDEVETFFHEFGHVMHQLCSRAEFALFSGTSVERDFVEAPSQMLENWVWQREALSRMSGHYSNGSCIPEDLMDSLIKSHVANAGVFNLRQILLGTFDQVIHTQTAKVDTAALFSKLSEEILGITSTPHTNMAASFGHLAGGYDAQYYGYMWSGVFSADMFYSLFKKDDQVMSSKVGMEYRKCILQPGGSMDASEMLHNFLGRDPQQDSFLISKGLKLGT